MLQKLHRIWLLPLLFVSGQALALGLGDIRLSSALNQPLRAEIELLAATPEELNNLTVQLASAETFSRYDLDRPLYLTRMRFDVVRSGRADGNFVRVTSLDPITEPFVTFLVEAVWSRGRLLREYTVLLDPPTFAPPPTAPSQQAVTAPSRATPADSGEIQRPAPQQPAPQPRPAPQTVQAPVQAPAEAAADSEPLGPGPGPAPVAAERTEYTPPPREAGLDPSDFSAASGGQVQVVRGDTLWGITGRVRPDSRLTFNQTMLAIFEANPDAFEGNINRLKAGATLRIPSASDIYAINRGDAFAEVQRQNTAWRGGATVADAVTEPAAQPNLTLVPPDEDELDLAEPTAAPVADEALDDVVDEFADDALAGVDDESEAIDDVTVDPIEARIREIETLLEDQDALIEIPDNELAALRAELAALQGADAPVDDGINAAVDDAAAVGAEQVDSSSEQPVTTAPAVVSRPARQESLVDRLLGYLTNFWVIIGAALVAALLVLVWFMRRSGGTDDDASGMWQALDDDDADLSATESLSTMGRHDDTTILVEENVQPVRDDVMVEDLAATAATEMPPLEERGATTELPAAVDDFELPFTPDEESLDATGTNESLEDTFSSETAINLDQSDPVAEADFHMAYGLYDQAADLINGALSAEPDRRDLLAKLCEIYFVWGNRDAFIDAAGRLQGLVGSGGDPEWDKIVIMGQQIAGDHEMFSGVSAGAATRAVDLSFDASDENTGALDMNLEDEPADDAEEGVIDLGAETGQVPISPARDSIDFSIDDEPDPLAASATREMPGADDAQFSEGERAAGSETPTIEQQFDVLDGTGELPTVQASAPVSGDATAEIDLDDLGLDLDSIADPSFAEDAGDLDDTSERAAAELADVEETGRNPAVEDTSATGIQEGIDIAATMLSRDDDATLLAGDETGINASIATGDEDNGAETDANLLDATGMTQVIGEDMAVDTGTGINEALSDDARTMLAPGPASPSAADAAELSDDAETLLASLDDDDDDDAGDFDFAKTEALPKDVFSPDLSTDDTGNMPGIAGGTDMDLDLDDLTAALKVSEVGDTVNQVRDDRTVEQPRLNRDDVDLDIGISLEGDAGTTQSLAPDDLSGDLHDARTMTEVGTKLDLARAYVDMGDPGGARSILEEVLDEGDDGQRQQAQRLLDSLPAA